MDRNDCYRTCDRNQPETAVKKASEKGQSKNCYAIRISSGYDKPFLYRTSVGNAHLSVRKVAVADKLP